MRYIGGEYRNRTGVHGFAIRPEIQGKQGESVSKHIPTNHELNEKVSKAELISTKENAAAVGPRNGAEVVYEAGQLPAKNTASLAARHPIIALHWGIVA